MFTWIANYFIGGVSGKVFTIVGGIIVVAWISLTIFLWNSLESKTEEVGKLEVEIISAVDVNDYLNSQIDTILLDKEKIEGILADRNKANVKLLEEANQREGVIHEEDSDACLDMLIPESIKRVLSQT